MSAVLRRAALAAAVLLLAAAGAFSGEDAIRAVMGERENAIRFLLENLP
jgi:hypothetical protein